jgi:hypothetical protein
LRFATFKSAAATPPSKKKNKKKKNYKINFKNFFFFLFILKGTLVVVSVLFVSFLLWKKGGNKICQPGREPI